MSEMDDVQHLVERAVYARMVDEGYVRLLKRFPPQVPHHRLSRRQQRRHPERNDDTTRSQLARLAKAKTEPPSTITAAVVDMWATGKNITDLAIEGANQ